MTKELKNQFVYVHDVCVHLWGSRGVGDCTCVCTCIWRPLVDTGCLPWLHSTLCFETVSFPILGEHRFVKNSWSVSSKDSFCFHLPSFKIQDCHNTWFSVNTGNLNLGLHAWAADSLPTKPSPQHKLLNNIKFCVHMISTSNKRCIFMQNSF